MQINSHYPRARGLQAKVGHPTGQTTISRPASRRSQGLARPAPCGFGFPVPRPPLAPCIIHPKRFRSNLRKSQEVGFSARLARAKHCVN